MWTGGAYLPESHRCTPPLSVFSNHLLHSVLNNYGKARENVTPVIVTKVFALATKTDTNHANVSEKAM